MHRTVRRSASSWKSCCARGAMTSPLSSPAASRRSIHPPGAIDDFTLRFVALLDGLALHRLRQLHQLSRKRVIELAMNAARAELAPDGPAVPAG